MSRLRPGKLSVRLAEGSFSDGPVMPRCYSLTHSDTTGDLFLTIGPDFDRAQISVLYTRLMRDEVLAEWREDEDGPALHVYCHVSGGAAACVRRLCGWPWVQPVGAMPSSVVSYPWCWSPFATGTASFLRCNRI